MYPAMGTVSACVEKFFPDMTVHQIQDFLYAFFPFLFGIYPYTFVTEKQKKAMDKAHANFVFLSVYEITRSFVRKLLER